MNIVTELIGFPHILTDIFCAVSCQTLMEAEKVPSWGSVISSLGIWRTRWRNAMAMVSPTRKILLTRMEHKEPELFNRIKDKDNSAYREAVNYVEGNTGRILQCSITDSSFYDDRRSHYCYFYGSRVKVDNQYIYIGFENGNIRILNRWTKECIKNIDRPNVLPRRTQMRLLQLSERHLATKLNNGTIVIYDLATFQQTQILNDDSVPFYPLECGGFCITSDILVNCRASNGTSPVLIVPKFNHETGLFGPDEMARAEFDWPRNSFGRMVYCWEKYIIVDMSENEDGAKLRTVRVIDMKSLKQVRKRTFTEPYNILIKEECHDGTIVSFDSRKNCLVTWNVETDIVQVKVEFIQLVWIIILIINLSECNGKMKFNIFKIEGRQCIDNFSLIKVQSKTFDENCLKSMKRFLSYGNFHLVEKTCYFDGVQFIYLGINFHFWKYELQILEFDV